LKHIHGSAPVRGRQRAARDGFDELLDEPGGLLGEHDTDSRSWDPAALRFGRHSLRL
jgi:hypothetical protein